MLGTDQSKSKCGCRKMLWQQPQLKCRNKMSFAANPSCQNVLQLSKQNRGLEKEFECVVQITWDTHCYKTWQLHRFSAFWLRSKCSICSYQLNIWYEDHVSSSILNLFLQGDGMSGACSGSIKSWLCTAVPQRSAHFPTSQSCEKAIHCLLTFRRAGFEPF